MGQLVVHQFDRNLGSAGSNPVRLHSGLGLTWTKDELGAKPCGLRAPRFGTAAGGALALQYGGGTGESSVDRGGGFVRLRAKFPPVIGDQFLPLIGQHNSQEKVYEHGYESEKRG